MPDIIDRITPREAPPVGREEGLPAKPAIPLRDDETLYKFFGEIMDGIALRISAVDTGKEKPNLLYVTRTRYVSAAYDYKMLVSQILPEPQSRRAVFALEIRETKGPDIKTGPDRNKPYRADNFAIYVAEDGARYDPVPFAVLTFGNPALTAYQKLELRDTVSRMLVRNGLPPFAETERQNPAALVVKETEADQPRDPADWWSRAPALKSMKPS